MRLQEIMSTQVHTASPDERADAAFHRMDVQGIHHLVVVDAGRVVGVLSQRDRRAPRRRPGHRGAAVRDLVSADVATATPTTTVRRAANLLRDRSIDCLPHRPQELLM